MHTCCWVLVTQHTTFCATHIYSIACGGFIGKERLREGERSCSFLGAPCYPVLGPLYFWPCMIIYPAIYCSDSFGLDCSAKIFLINNSRVILSAARLAFTLAEKRSTRALSVLAYTLGDNKSSVTLLPQSHPLYLSLDPRPAFVLGS